MMVDVALGLQGHSHNAEHVGRASRSPRRSRSTSARRARSSPVSGSPKPICNSTSAVTVNCAPRSSDARDLFVGEIIAVNDVGPGDEQFVLQPAARTRRAPGVPPPTCMLATRSSSRASCISCARHLLDRIIRPEDREPKRDQPIAARQAGPCSSRSTRRAASGPR